MLFYITGVQLGKAEQELERTRSAHDSELKRIRSEVEEYARRCEEMAAQLQSAHCQKTEAAAATDRALDELMEKLADLQGADEKWRAESEEKVKIAEEVQICLCIVAFVLSTLQYYNLPAFHL